MSSEITNSELKDQLDRIEKNYLNLASTNAIEAKNFFRAGDIRYFRCCCFHFI